MVTKDKIRLKDTSFEIVQSNYKMIYDGNVSFDLFFKDKKGEWRLHGYNMKLEQCIKVIMLRSIDKDYDTLTLKEFFKEIKRLHDELINYLKLLGV